MLMLCTATLSRFFIYAAQLRGYICLSMHVSFLTIKDSSRSNTNLTGYVSDVHDNWNSQENYCVTIDCNASSIQKQVTIKGFTFHNKYAGFASYKPLLSQSRSTVHHSHVYTHSNDCLYGHAECWRRPKESGDISHSWNVWPTRLRKHACLDKCNHAAGQHIKNLESVAVHSISIKYKFMY